MHPGPRDKRKHSEGVEWTYTVSETEHLISIFPFFTVVALQPVLFHLDDFSGELDTHDRFGCLGRQRVLSLALHDVHPVEAKGFHLRHNVSGVCGEDGTEERTLTSTWPFSNVGTCSSPMYRSSAVPLPFLTRMHLIFSGIEVDILA